MLTVKNQKKMVVQISATGDAFVSHRYIEHDLMCCLEGLQMTIAMRCVCINVFLGLVTLAFGWGGSSYLPSTGSLMDFSIK